LGTQFLASFYRRIHLTSVNPPACARDDKPGQTKVAINADNRRTGWELLHDDRTVLNAKGLWALIYVAGPGGALMSVQALGASRAGVFLYFQTVFIAVLAYFLLGERLLPYHLTGAFFIMAGVLLVMLLKPGPARS
jgi:drug/metabolite transporter (DMT)-like permease